jgi:hypothetical protein
MQAGLRHQNAELKAARQQGRKQHCYPYAKTRVQTLGEQD